MKINNLLFQDYTLDLISHGEGATIRLEKRRSAESKTLRDQFHQCDSNCHKNQKNIEQKDLEIKSQGEND